MAEKKEGWFDPKTATEDALKLMKSSFDATFDNVVKVQNLNEEMLKGMLEKGEEMREDSVKMVKEFIENAKKGRDEYKKFMEDGFKKLEQMMKTGK